LRAWNIASRIMVSSTTSCVRTPLQCSSCYRTITTEVSTWWPDYPETATVALAFLRCERASTPAATRSMESHITHRRIKIERACRPELDCMGG
jgi:hypothetical protein